MHFEGIDVTIQQPDQDQAASSAGASPALSDKGAARRRFAKSGAAVTGVLLTVTSRPGMACDICTTPSGYASANLKSTHATKPVVCAGRSPGYWKNASAWPKGCKTTNTYGTVFSCNSVNTSYRNCKMGTILSPQSFDRYNVGMHLTAAYLNVQAGITSYLTIGMLQAIWNEYQSKGYYTPTYGKKWYGADIVAYLQGTMY